MGTNEYSQPASKSSWDSQDFGDVNMVVKMAHFHKSSRPQWVKVCFHLRGTVAGRTRDGDRWRKPPAVVRFHYSGFSAGASRIHRG